LLTAPSRAIRFPAQNRIEEIMGEDLEEVETPDSKVDLASLRERVEIAELLARQAEAEVRYIKAQAERKAMKKNSDRKPKKKNGDRDARAADRQARKNRRASAASGEEKS
jgi:hypothetical protein